MLRISLKYTGVFLTTISKSFNPEYISIFLKNPADTKNIDLLRIKFLPLLKNFENIPSEDVE